MLAHSSSSGGDDCQPNKLTTCRQQRLSLLFSRWLSHEVGCYNQAVTFRSCFQFCYGCPVWGWLSQLPLCGPFPSLLPQCLILSPCLCTSLFAWCLCFSARFPEEHLCPPWAPEDTTRPVASCLCPETPQWGLTCWPCPLGDGLHCGSGLGTHVWPKLHHMWSFPANPLFDSISPWNGFSERAIWGCSPSGRKQRSTASLMAPWSP